MVTSLLVSTHGDRSLSEVTFEQHPRRIETALRSQKQAIYWMSSPLSRRVPISRHSDAVDVHNISFPKSCYRLFGYFDSLHLLRELRRSKDPSDSAMFPFGLFLVFGVATGKSGTVDNWIVHIDDGILQRVEASNQASDHLDLSAFPVQSLAPHCFAGVRGLKKLTVWIKLDEFQMRQDLPPLVFRYLSNLEHLSLANSNIRKTEYAFWGLSNLRVLDLRKSDIILDQGSLFGISNATEILLTGTNVLDVKPEHFLKPNNPLVGLCMSDRVVRSVDVFQNMIKMTDDCDVQWLKMYGNVLYLDSMGIETFVKGWYRITDGSVIQLSLLGNEITDLSSNLINDLPKDIQVLNLAWNKIKRVERRKIDNPNLRVLNLAGNPIVRIDPTAFAMTKLKKLVLTLDFMRYLPMTLESLDLFVRHEKRNYDLKMHDLSIYD